MDLMYRHPGRLLWSIACRLQNTHRL